MRNVRVLKSGAGPSSRTKLLCRLRNSSESDIFGSSGHSFAFARTIFLCAWRDSTVPYRRCDAARASSNTSSATAPVSKRLSSFNVFGFNKAKFHYTDPTRTGPDTDKVRAHCRRRAKFHYTDTDTYPTRTRHGPDRTRTDPHGLFLRRNSVGSVRVRSGPCSGI